MCKRKPEMIIMNKNYFFEHFQRKIRQVILEARAQHAPTGALLNRELQHHDVSCSTFLMTSCHV